MKKTEAELRHDIRKENSLSENNPKEKAVIDKMLKLKKDKFQLNRQKKELEDKVTSDPQGEKKEPQGDKMDYKDVRALQNVHDEDVDKVTDYAEKFNLSVADAMKDEDLKAILSRREEERKSSEAIETGKKMSGDSKIDGHKVLAKVKKNPDKELSDDEMEAVAEARWQEKHPKK